MSQQQDQPSFAERRDAQTEQQARQAAQETAFAAARKKHAKRVENPEFFQQLRDADFPSDKEDEFSWLEDELGPATSGAHIIGNRSPDYEHEVKWLMQNRAERVLAETEPGRLCRGTTRQIAEGVHGRPDKEPKPPRTTEERRGVRSAFRALTNLRALAVGAKGLDSVTQATAVSKVEKSEDENKSTRERVAGFLG